MTYILHKLSEGFIITSDETAIEKGELYFDTFDKELKQASCYYQAFQNKKVIAQQDQIDFSLVENIINSLNYPIKIEGYFEHNLFKITKIWENY